MGKKKLPDPGAKRQVIWGLVGSVSTDKAGLRDAFGEYSYETKTKGAYRVPTSSFPFSLPSIVKPRTKKA